MTPGGQQQAFPVMALPVRRVSISSRLREQASAAAPFVLFLLVAVALWLLVGNRLILGTNDEGIYLDAADRMVHGQKLYVDFFGYMSPGSFWMQAAAFRLFGVTLAAGRILVIAYIALQCALIYWLVARFASRATALVTMLLFLAFETADPTMLTAQHRWDSGAFALASIALCLSVRRRYLFAAGALLAYAALATPSVALAAIATLFWLRRRAGWYLAGAAATGAAAVAALWSQGILGAFLSQLAWLSHNYSVANVMPYGSIIGGYAALFRDAGIGEWPVRLSIVLCLALPAILPIVAVAGGTADYIRRREAALIYLLLCIAALVASTHPRSDIQHLAYISALPYAVAGILLYRWLSARARAWLAAAIGIWAVVFVWQGQLHGNMQVVRTPVGDVRASADEAPAITDLLSRIRPHQTLFVYPYKPLFYFLTQAQNPTRYSYLAPGLMTAQDASLALSELQAHPPEWVLYMNLDSAEFERVFPSAKGLDPHFPQIESWIQSHYRTAGMPPLGGYLLLRRLPTED